MSTLVSILFTLERVLSNLSFSTTRPQGKKHNIHNHILICNGSFLFSKLLVLDFGVHVLVRKMSGTVVEMKHEEIRS